MQDTLLVWIDLEMTGLNSVQDQILEIACVITDGQLKTVAQGPQLIIHQSQTVLAAMSPAVRELHTASGLLPLVAQSKIHVSDAQQQVYDFIAQHCINNQGRLAGNTIWQDRLFLARYMPRILQPMHYRIIDVSTVKELVLQWYPSVPKYEKQNKHRALDDIYESIAELRYYREHYFK